MFKSKKATQKAIAAEEEAVPKELTTEVMEYILAGLKSNLLIRNEALQLENKGSFYYHQGGLDVLTDLETIICGVNLETAAKKVEVNNIDTV